MIALKEKIKKNKEEEYIGLKRYAFAYHLVKRREQWREDNPGKPDKLFLQDVEPYWQAPRTIERYISGKLPHDIDEVLENYSICTGVSVEDAAAITSEMKKYYWEQFKDQNNFFVSAVMIIMFPILVLVGVISGSVTISLMGFGAALLSVLLLENNFWGSNYHDKETDKKFKILLAVYAVIIVVNLCISAPYIP